MNNPHLITAHITRKEFLSLPMALRRKILKRATEAFLAPGQSMRHGIDCKKAPHNNPNGGYLHHEDDDRPYDVDGMAYCGRCHHVL